MLQYFLRILHSDIYISAHDEATSSAVLKSHYVKSQMTLQSAGNHVIVLGIHFLLIISLMMLVLTPIRFHQVVVGSVI